RERHARGRVGHAAHPVGAGVLLTEGVGAAVRGGEAADAGALAVAHQVRAAVGARRQVGVGGDAAGADVVRAGVAVRRLVGVVGDGHRRAVAVALDLLAVAGRLGGERRARGRVGDAGRAVGGGRVVTIGVGAGAAGGRQTGHAGALAVADRVRAAAVAGGDERVRRGARGADVLRAGVAVDGQVEVVVDGDGHAAAADVLLAVTR